MLLSLGDPRTEMYSYISRLGRKKKNVDLDACNMGSNLYLC